MTVATLHAHAIFAADSEGWAVTYPYTEQLLPLDQCTPVCQADVPSELADIQTPIVFQAWQEGLQNHPDQQFAKFVLRGLSEGFRIGFQYSSSKLQSAHRNMLITNPEVVADYIKTEVVAKRLVELSRETAAALAVHCSPIGIIPKKNRPGKWRLIVDLLSPESASVNDGIRKELCSQSYTSVDAIADRIVAMGRGTLLAKLDIKQAYRMVPVHPDDRRLLGMTWGGRVYVDKALPFGLRSAPLIFTAVADALQWIMKQEGVSIVDHYLDDFITLGRPGSSECADNFRRMLKTCRSTGTPVEEGKSVGPTPKLTYLGIELDSSALEMRLPAEKLAKLKEAVTAWRGKKSV